jgi:hypothetical protein
MNARERGVRAHAFGAGRHLEWRIRRACSPLDACGAWQRSRFAERARSLNVGHGRDRKSRDTKTLLRLVYNCVLLRP